MSAPWTPIEIHTILPAYFEMLAMEMRGESFVKAHVKNQLAAQLQTRNGKAIEYKFMNISAVLEKYALPYIVGYKPLRNYQHLLEEVVIDYLDRQPELQSLFLGFVDRTNLSLAANPKFAQLIVDPPARSTVSNSISNEPPNTYFREPRKYNYLEREQQNRKLGELGESLAFEYEKWRLSCEGKISLADRVEWVARDQGDGAGFDIRSFDLNGADRFVEVKTTQFGETTPIYFTRNELRFSRNHPENFHLYRIFHCTTKPKLFTVKGALDEICTSEAISFMGRF